MNFEHNRQIHLRATPRKHPNGKGVSNHVKRCALHVDRNDSHTHKTGRDHYKIKQKLGHDRMGLRRGNSKLAAPGRSWGNSQSGRERENINPSVHRRKQTIRSRIWSSHFQSEMTAKLQIKLDNRCSTRRSNWLYSKHWKN